MATNESPEGTPPQEFVIPRRIVVSRRCFEEILARMKDQVPTPALVALMRGTTADHPSDGVPCEMSDYDLY